MKVFQTTKRPGGGRINTPFSRAEFRRSAILIVAIVAIAFVGLRAVHLTADFPSDITISSDLYTDEGWYNNAAISLHLFGRWYRPGDFNPIVNLPLFQIVQAAVTGVFGLTLTVARMTAVVTFVGLVILSYRLIAQSFGIMTGLLALLLLTTNMLLFAYSRFAVIEMPITLLALAATMSLASNHLRTRQVMFATFCVVLALLMKTTAVFVVPVVALLLWTSDMPTSRKRINSAIMASGLGVALAYHMIVRSMFPADYAFFAQRNIADRIVPDASTIGRNIMSAVRDGNVIDRIAYVPTLVFTSLLWVTWRRQSRVFVALSMWSISYLGLLSLTWYHPARYYVPLAVPLTLLLAITLKAVWSMCNGRTSRHSAIRSALVAFILLVLGTNAMNVIDYIRTPRYTWITASRDIQQRIATSDRPDGILMGDIANSISLATGHPSINATWGIQSVTWKLERYAPAFYVSLGQDRATQALIEIDHDLVLLQAYDVMNNYYHGDRVFLYAIRPRPGDGQPRQRGEQ